LAFLSCTNSDKIVDFKDDTVVLNVKPQNIHYTRALVLQFIQKNNLKILSDKKSIINGRYKLMEIEFTISEKLMLFFLNETELQAQIPKQKWHKPFQKMILKCTTSIDFIDVIPNED
jgi:hypothetical protein